MTPNHSDTRSRARQRLAALACALAAFIGTAAHAKPAADDVDLWPLYERSADSLTIAYPLYVQEDDFLMVGPFYARTRSGRDHHVLWPLVKLADGRVDRVAPFFFRGDEGEYSLLPLVRRTRESTFWLVPPVYRQHAGDFVAVFPFFARDARNTWALPNLKIERDEQGRIDGIVSFGLFAWSGDGDSNAFVTALGLAGRSREADTETTWLLPLFAAHRSPERESTWVGPVNVADGKDFERRCFVPLYCALDRDTRTLRQIGPWYRDETPERTRHGVAGLYSVGHRAFVGGNTRDSLRFLGGAVARQTTRDASGAIIERERRFLLLRDRQTPSERRIALLGLPIWERTARGAEAERG